MDSGGAALLTWLREACSRYRFDVIAVYKVTGGHKWPLTAGDEADLVRQLSEGGHLLPLPSESAALANVIEVSLVNFLLEELKRVEGAEARRGTDRFYPDLEVGGPAFGGGFHAVDIKVARRKIPKRSAVAETKTQSRITLYTGNTYFKWPSLHWPGTFRPFEEYASHLDVICLYTHAPTVPVPVENLELLVHEPWRIASKTRSSTTREYIGAVDSLAQLRAGTGDFTTEADFYSYWRKYKFKISEAVQTQLEKLLAKQRAHNLRPPGESP